MYFSGWGCYTYLLFTTWQVYHLCSTLSCPNCVTGSLPPSPNSPSQLSLARRWSFSCLLIYGHGESKVPRWQLQLIVLLGFSAVFLGKSVSPLGTKTLQSCDDRKYKNTLRVIRSYCEGVGHFCFHPLVPGLISFVLGHSAMYAQIQCI